MHPRTLTVDSPTDVRPSDTSKGYGMMTGGPKCHAR